MKSLERGVDHPETVVPTPCHDEDRSVRSAPLDPPRRQPRGHVATERRLVAEAGLETVDGGEIEDIPTAVHQDLVVVLGDEVVDSLVGPLPVQYVGITEDVAQPEHEVHASTLAEDFDGGLQLAHRSLRHVVDQKGVGSERRRDGPQQVDAKSRMPS